MGIKKTWFYKRVLEGYCLKYQSPFTECEKINRGQTTKNCIECNYFGTVRSQ